MDRFPPPHPIYPPVIHYGPAPIPLRKEPHIPLTPKTGMRREEIERRLSEINVTAEDKAAWNAKYAKPSTGIPKADLASSVQASLGKADTALQQHQSLDGYATEEWVEDQGYLTEHQDITGKVDKSVLFDNPDTNPMVKSTLLPSYVDDVLEYASTSGFPSSGETGKIYVAKDTNKTYRWTGTQYVQVGGDEQAQADWNQSDSGAPDYIKNKPTIPDAQIQSDWNQSDTTAKDFIKNKPTIPAAQVQANWNENDTSSKAFIQNKPTIPTVPTNVSAFTNDAGYLTQHQSLSAYRTAAAQDAIDNVQTERIGAVENNAQQALNGVDVLERVKAYGYALAAAYDPNRGSAYAVGDYCTNAGTLFKCTTATANPPGSWDAANWTAVAVTDEMGGGGGGLPYDAEVEYIQAADGQYIDTGIPANAITGSSGIVQTTSGTKSMFGARDGAGSNMLYLGYYSTNVNGLRLSYGSSTDGNKVSSSHLSGFVSLGWNQSTMWYGNNSASVSLSGSVTSRNAYLFTFNNGGTPITGETTTMAIRSFQIFGANGEVLRDYIAVRKNGVGYLYDRVSGALFGNAGTGAFTFGSDLNNVRYAFASPTPSVSGTTATVACEDRAINDFTVATGVTSLTITPPAAVTGRARDFFCRVSLTDSSLPTVTLSGGTIDIGSTEVAGMTQGVNLLMFTEIASGHWLASRRSAS